MNHDFSRFSFKPKCRSFAEASEENGMNCARKRSFFSDSSDEDLTFDKKPRSSLNQNGYQHQTENKFISLDSGDEDEVIELQDEDGENDDAKSKQSSSSDNEHASPVIVRTKKRRFRFISEESTEDDESPGGHRFNSSEKLKNTNSGYFLSSSSDDEGDSNKTVTSVQRDSSPPPGKYVISISKKSLAGPRSSVDPLKFNPNHAHTGAMKSKASNHPLKKKKHNFSKMNDHDDDSIDEGYKHEILDSDFSSDDEYNRDGQNISEQMKLKILNLFQESSSEELATISKISPMKSEVIVNLRPFKSWEDLLIKFDNKPLNRFLIWNSIDFIKERHTLCSLMHKCSQISKKLQAEFDRLRDQRTESPRKCCKDLVVSQQPQNINPNYCLKPYQIIGLNWLALLHRNKVSGILADEMGLGKTIQTISFLAYLQEAGISDGPHLIIVPSSTLDNWIRELSVWCPSFNVVLYNGSQTERRAIRTQLLRGYISCNVILATYNQSISVAEDRMLFRKLGVYYAVFDEGHMLKNMSSQRFQYLMRISAEYRLLLTGTPLQNNLLELMSLLRFVMPNMFEETTSTLVRLFTHSNSDNSSTFARQRIEHAKQIMKPFVLRRLKNSVLHQLPEKVETICDCDLTIVQAELYEKIKAKFKYSKHNMPKSELKNVYVELRKIANHPLLRRDHFPDSKLRDMARLLKDDITYLESNEMYLFEDMQVMNDFELHKLCLSSRPIKKFRLSDSTLLDSGKFKRLDLLLPKMKEDGKRILIFSQFTMMMDILEVYLKLRGHTFLRLDGQTPVSDRIDLIDKFNNDSSYFTFILSTKAGGLGINLTAASVVILHDIDCNPYNDKQAEDRCHRLGQTKQVEVIRLIAKNTIEERIFKIAQYKLRLEKDMTESDDDAVNLAALITQSLE